MTKIYNLVPGSVLLMEKTNGYSSLVVNERLGFLETNLVKKDHQQMHFRYKNINYYVQLKSVYETDE